jgi:hypothetical protein
MFVRKIQNEIPQFWTMYPGRFLESALKRRGVVCGTAFITDCKKYGSNDFFSGFAKNNIWAFGPWCWKLNLMTPCVPVPRNGQLSLWNYRGDLFDLYSNKKIVSYGEYVDPRNENLHFQNREKISATDEK